MNSLPLWLIPLAPVFAALLAGFLALTRRVEKAAPWLTIVATALSGLTALGHVPDTANALANHQTIEWLSIPNGLSISLGVHLDALAWIMVVIVCTVSVLVQIYSLGYMKGEKGFARYFAYLGLFTASMLGLVVADNLFQLYVCWELVGICSYLLIGFWWQKPSAASAAKKAFVVTRFGDVGFLLGVLLLVGVAGSFQFSAVAQAVTGVQAGQITPPLVSGEIFLWLAPLLLFCGAIGKSAQFPLHVWLPDAMEGPTPVSALIHAATMVAAGVYMVARLFFLFAASPIATNTVLVIGAITAFIAATIALVQVDIKKVMAYSTISQLGYMMLGLGAVGANYPKLIQMGAGVPLDPILMAGQTAGMFHLTTHAMFKALLFLTAGSVIHALHHAKDPNDMRGMGGLLKRMPITGWTCLIGVLALAGLFPLAGFWSKDAVLGVALESGKHNGVAMFGLIVGIIAAGLTAFYGMRMWMLAFWGQPRSEEAAHAHESPPTMTLPLIVLAIPSVLLGWLLHSGHRFASFLVGPGVEVAEPMNVGLIAVTTVVAVAGIGLAWRLYSAPSAAADPVERLPGHAFLANLWYLDAFWNAVGAHGALTLGRIVAWFDRTVVDGLVNAVGEACRISGRELRRTANGQAQSYTAAMLVALVVAVLALVLYQSQASARTGYRTYPAGQIKRLSDAQSQFTASRV
jgi:NADH-quinone oxidoreductase subunit L